MKYQSDHRRKAAMARMLHAITDDVGAALNLISAAGSLIIL
jgi:hypothetical protein